MPDPSEPSAVYDAGFFDAQSAGSLRSARVILSRVFEWLQPASIIDVGCGVGTWLRAARELGATTVVGVDGDYVDRTRLVIDETEFVSADLASESVSERLGSDLPTTFDLAICLEVGEHLPIGRARNLVVDLTTLSDVILFSAAVPFQAGSNHINEQWPEFWAILFAEQGFECRDVLRHELWLNRDVEWWYAQNALVFVRSGKQAALAVPPGAQTPAPPLSIVHPQNLLFQVLNAFRTHRAAARVEEAEDYYTLATAYSQGSTVIPDPMALQRAASAHPDSRNVFPYTRIEVSNPEHEIEMRDRALDRLAEELEFSRNLSELRNNQLDETRTLLSASTRDLEVTRELLSQRSEDTIITRGLLSERSKELDETRRLLNVRSDELTMTRALMDERFKQLADAQATAADLEERLLNMKHEFEIQKANLESIERSASWRVTAPIRTLMGQLRSHKR